MVTNSDTNSSDTSRSTVDQYNNPYFLHHNDHARLSLVSDKLTTGADFHSWRRSVRMGLNVRNKLGFIDGTIPKPPENHRDFGSWSRCNDMIATWIMNSVCKKIGQSLLFIPTAERIYKNLCSRFKQDDAPRIYQIEQRLSQIQQGSMDISAYYTELITLWEEYKIYVELPVCTCGKCECSAAALWEKLQERSRVTKFLMGLNDSYESSRRHILMLKPIPPIEEVFNMLTSDERQKTIKPKSEGVVFQTSGPPPPITQENIHYSSLDASMYQGYSENMAFAVHNGYRPPRPVCTHCGQTGHVIQKCFKLHGYPPGYIPGYKSMTSCYQSQRPHAPRGQFQPNPRPQSVANVMNNPFLTAPMSTAINNANAANAENNNAASTLDFSKLSSDQM